MLWRNLRKQGFATAACTGVYEGREKQSILVIDETPHVDDCFNAVLRLARVYAQRDVLAVDTNRNANLVPTDAREGAKWIGRFVSVTKDVAIEGGYYTCRAGRYYVCR